MENEMSCKTLEILATEAFVLVGNAQKRAEKKLNGIKITDKETNIITSNVFQELVGLYKCGKMKITDI